MGMQNSRFGLGQVGHPTLLHALACLTVLLTVGLVFFPCQTYAVCWVQQEAVKCHSTDVSPEWELSCQSGWYRCACVYGTDLCTYVIWGYLVCLHFQHTKIRRRKIIINFSRHVMRFVCFPFWNMPSAGFSGAHKCVSLWTDVSLCHKCVPLCAVLPVVCIAFCVVLGQFKVRLAFRLQSTSIHHLGSCVSFKLVSLR